jgi:flagellar motor switch protein FliM
LNRQLSQHEIDAVFRQSRKREREAPAFRFDFQRTDRIPKSQVRAIHALHDTFARNLVSSLSAYLRSYLTVNLVSVEQLSYAEFLEGVASPTCMVSLGLRPYDGNGVLEMNPSLLFPILEMLLGGSGKASTAMQRDVTEIERKVMDGVLRIILNDLREAWKAVDLIEFSIESMETEPQLLRLLAPNEAVVVIAIEARIGDSAGMMNIALPSIVIKMMRQKFDQQRSTRKLQSNEAQQARVLRLLHEAQFTVEALLKGPTLRVSDLLSLTEGRLLTLDCSAEAPVKLLVNGVDKFSGQIVAAGRNRAFQIEKMGVASGENQ